MEELGLRVKQKRGAMGIREAAKEVGVSPATLSRVEAGKQPDLSTFEKLCKWLDVDPNTLLGVKKSSPAKNLEFGDATGHVFAHFRAKKTMNSETASHLAKLIEAMNREL
jgi:transcriptional regulator with XRE-family HTH domain